jgi:hypothetical protein
MATYISNRFITFEYKSITQFGLVWFVAFNAIFNNISVLLVEATGIDKNHRPVAGH